MLFVETRFFIFFAVVLAIYWKLPTNNLRKWFLLFCSYFFYGCWDWRFVIMLAGLSAADYYFALRLGITEDLRWRRILVSLSVLMNLSVLFFFKYFGFFTKSAVGLANVFGLNLSQPAISIILPIGVSFFTFQSLSYTIDVYRRQIKPVQNLRDYLLFAAFFPQLVSGPIVRPHYFLPQLEDKRARPAGDIRFLLATFFIGFFKKACIADNISPYVENVFNAPQNYDTLSSITAVWLYTVQIFCDFSGYTDMAIAVAGFMGFHLVPNFDAPYLSSSIQDFWRRWHISLSSWIRDYIYLTLGGRSKFRLFTYRNLVITMLLGGLWHGASWTFVAWGGLHGLALALNQEFRHHFRPGEKPSLIRRAIGWFLTINFVCCTWILFRATSFDTAAVIFKKYLLLDWSGASTLPLWLVAVGPVLLFIQYAMRRYTLVPKWAALNETAFVFLYGMAWAVTFALVPLERQPFIYFQF